MNMNKSMKDDLAPGKLARPMDRLSMGAEVAALNDLMKLMNDPSVPGVEVPEGVDTRVPRAPVVPPPSPVEPPQPAPRQANTTRLFFTGKLKSGKDYAAKAVGAEIFGFADPIYELASKLTGLEISASKGKDLPGVRALLQAIGQWGRNEVNVQYPLTPARILFVQMVRNSFPGYQNFGENKDIWIDSLLARLNVWAEVNAGKRAAITNVRFQNEFKVLQAAGWTGWHVMCSPTTWAKRLEASKLTPQSPAVNDMSEALAAALDKNVIQQISAQKNGARLRCIWNDEFTPPPSARIHTMNSFLQTLAISELPVDTTNADDGILTGE